ncbi:Signal peptidase I [Actinomadura sp. RB99]|uniref:signal peptidase I n=1 Tax=Actinomadura sp. RB99 TaxID=2691577 RepID=UPI001683CD9E|nr:signal peptidase I [Actinomadura sp. RB99]MBD2893266.1 Signal peptidase I [Actinomadura sp. RB99]
MRRRVIALAAVPWLVAGCGAANSAVHGYHRYSDPSVAMEPTIRAGQTFDARPVDHGDYKPKRGDVVVFSMPSWLGGRAAPQVKRVVAIPGDRISCCSRDGRVMLNGAALDEPYLAEGTRESTFGPVSVPAGRLWLMGDNRGSSADSRYHLGDGGQGTVPASAVVGVAVLK